MTFIEDLRKMLEGAELYSDLLYPFSGSMNVGIVLTDTGESATVSVGEVSRVLEGLVTPAVRITMTRETFERVRDGEADAFALGGRSKMSESRPINFESIDPERAAEVMEAVKGMATFFFNPGKVKTKELSLEGAGEAHGARPIPLVYWKGLRTAWYHVPAGSVLNEAGEKDPWPQAFVVLRGSGRVQIADEDLELKTSCVYYIPRDCTHKIHADSPVELIWIAWDAE
ncbi:cupin domain-containing protein [Candidatus Thorarchaeota archaeon]|nr:MAG: cupin domain-containing protein [Candidatus Thorarchaeota archaeon]